jgi:hypothetical protein
LHLERDLLGSKFAFKTGESTCSTAYSEDMLQFLSEFVDAHPELDGNDFYITGRV